MSQLSGGAIEAIISGESVDKPILQLISFKKITAQGAGVDRYRLLLSDGELSYSHAMLATQMNEIVDSGEMDALAVIQVNKYLCNKIQGDKRVLIVLETDVLQRGVDVGGRIGNPQQYKTGSSAAGNENAAPQPQVQQPPVQQPQQNNFYGNKPAPAKQHQVSAPNHAIKASTPGTPGSNRVHPINSLTPYQNRWKIRARVTQKSNIRTWSNSRGEGKLFSVNLLDESGEIRATGFTDAVDKFYELLEVNKVYFISRATLKTANKQYSTVNNDYEMTFNADTQIDLCTDDVGHLPCLKFNFKKINELENCDPNSTVDIIGVVKNVGEMGTVVGKQSQREIIKRDITLVDQSGMSVRMTLWGNDAENFQGKEGRVVATKGCRLSDFGGRSLSCLASSQMVVDPDVREAHFLQGWYDKEGYARDFGSFQGGGGGAGAGGSTNWKCFAQVKEENLGAGDKPDYFTAKGHVLFMKKDNCMYQACPSEACNKKVIDQGNGMFRCEKCNKEYPNFKWRMILQANLADYSDNNWVTCFQDSAEILLGKTADEIGTLRETNEAAFDQMFNEALFTPYIFRLRAKVETYNDEPRLKTVCMSAKCIEWPDYGRQLVEEIKAMTG